MTSISIDPSHPRGTGFRSDAQSLRFRLHMPVVLCLAAAAILSGTSARADRWSLTSFTTAHGLPSDSVVRAIEDRHGFLWFGTGEGLSRFDGRNFRNFGVAQGLQDPHIADLLEAGDGVLWVGTADGAYRFDPAGGGRFLRVPSPHGAARWSASVLLRDRRGRVWCGGLGLYYAEEQGGTFRLLQRDLGGFTPEVFALLEDRSGSLWVGSQDLLRLGPDGSVQRIVLPDPPNGVGALAQDRQGRIWVGSARGLYRLEDREGDQGSPNGRVLIPSPQHQPLKQWVEAILEGRDGTLWVGTRTAGIAVIDPNGGTPAFADEIAGVPLNASPLLEDRAGNLWMRTPARGLLRRAPEGFVFYGTREGLASADVSSILRSRSGELVVAAKPRVLHKLVGDRFIAVRPQLPPLFLPGWGSGQYELQDADGKWWIPTGEGLFRFPRTERLEDLGRIRPEVRFTKKDGLAGHDVFRLFEDSRRDLWITTLDPVPQNLTRWERAANRFHRYGEAEGLPPSSVPTAFLEDAQGDLWIGHFAGQLTRRQGGRFASVPVPDGMARSSVRRLLLDRQGRLWIATTRGLFLCDQPGAENPSIVSLGSDFGLSSVGVRWIEEDASGRLYAATSRGIHRFDPDTGRVWHFTAAQGPPLSAMLVGFRDRDDSLWLGGIEGLARVRPLPDRSGLSPPVVRIDGLRIAGRLRPLSATGEDRVTGLELKATERQIEIDWVGLNLDAAEPPTFEYRLRVSDNWSPPTQQRSVAFSDLAAGRYRFQVRSRAASGGPSSPPAIVDFEVLAPFWRTWWFLSLTALLLTGAAWVFYRQRVSRLLALEQQRTRIAMDLHDELGSGLGSIGLLADLAADPSLDDAGRRELNREIGDTAAELGTSLSDILASLRPGASTMESLGRFLAERARRLFPGTGAALTVDFPPVWPPLSLPLAVHRNVLLVALEALHNAARHSGAAHVKLSLGREGRRWSLEVEDDGRGIDQAAGGGRQEGGLGLESMRRRAAAIGAHLECRGSPGMGTTIRLVFDTASRRRGWRFYRR